MTKKSQDRLARDGVGPRLPQNPGATPQKVSPQMEAILNGMFSQALAGLEMEGVQGTGEMKHKAAFRAAQDGLGLQQVLEYLQQPAPRAFDVGIRAMREPVLKGAEPAEVWTTVVDRRGLDPALYDLTDDEDLSKFLGTHLGVAMLRQPIQRAMHYIRNIRFVITRLDGPLPSQAPPLEQDNEPPEG